MARGSKQVRKLKNAILLHGWNTKDEFFDPTKPTASNDHWFPWLTKQLMVRGYKVDVPEMTQYSQTTYESWKKEFERFDLNQNTLLVGHSCGGGFLVRYLSENYIQVGRVLLVAPWLGLHLDDFPDKDFFAFTANPKIADKTTGLYVIYSTDDFESIQDSVNLLKNTIDGAKYIALQNKGHFTRTSLGTDAFPELLELCLQTG